MPVGSENAAAEVPAAEVASQVDLEAAASKSNAGPTDVVGGDDQSPPSVARSTPGRSGSVRQQKRPRTVDASQLVPGAEFEGVVVGQQLMQMIPAAICTSLRQ